MPSFAHCKKNVGVDNVGSNLKIRIFGRDLPINVAGQEPEVEYQPAPYKGSSKRILKYIGYLRRELKTDIGPSGVALRAMP